MKRFVVLGAAESGVGSAILAQQKGYDVFVSDMGQIKPQYEQMLIEHSIAYEQGQHTEEKILNADLVVKSPGIPATAPMVKALADKGTPILSEIEFAARYTPAKFICITGSNGKTTTTSLIYDILVRAGYNVGLAGNIGKSLALQVADEAKSKTEVKTTKYYVVELSSFQLDNMYEFKANVAILMNITPDHLDRYDNCFQNYVDSKLRITQNQTIKDAFIYWSEDPVMKQELLKHDFEGSMYAFGERTSNPAYVSNGIMHVQIENAEPLSIPVAELALQGKHNQLNSMAATLAAQLVGVPNQVIEGSLRHFGGVEHRLQFVREVNDVRWINDSKATNVNSCWYALEAMTRPTVLILGGKDKGNDYTEIDELVKEKCHTIVFMGLHNEKLHEHFDGMLLKNGETLCTIETNSLADCIVACQKAAKAGETVLLSPCCASFDLFKSYEDRGEQFMAAVNHL